MGNSSPLVFEVSIDVYRLARLSTVAIGALASVYLAYYAGFKMASKPRRKRKARETKDNDEIEEIVGRLRLTDDTLRDVMKIIEEEMQKAMTGNPEFKSELKMIPVFVHSLPDENLKGKFVALDLGGTNFRIAEVDLREDGNTEERSKVYIIPDRILMDEGTELFAYVANCLGGFMRLRNLAYRKNKVPLAFCFSFPCEYYNIRSATLIHWSKGFNCKNTQGKNIGEMLQEALDKRPDTKAELKAITNDSVSCMMACAYKEVNCMIGAIFGSGINACYLEDTAKLSSLKPEIAEQFPKTVVNIEWGGLGDRGTLEFLRTQYDSEIDKLSSNPGLQTFEKMVSGLYIGDLAWLIIQELINRDLLFRGVLSKNQRFSGYMLPLDKRGILSAKKLSEIEMDAGVKFKSTKELLAELGLKDASYDDCAIVKYVCDLVSMRSAQLAAAALASLINYMNLPNVVIGVDGSLFRHHHKFRQNMEMTVARLVHRDLGYRLVLNEEGSAKGSAIVAAMTQQRS